MPSQENPDILEKIKNMFVHAHATPPPPSNPSPLPFRYIATNFTKQGASGYQPRKQNYMSVTNCYTLLLLLPAACSTP